MSDNKKSRAELINELTDLRLENSSLKFQVAETDRRSAVIMELRKAEEALRGSEERYRIISSLTMDYIFSFKEGEDGKIQADMISDGGSADIECRSFLPDCTLRTVRDVAHASVSPE